MNIGTLDRRIILSQPTPGAAGAYGPGADVFADVAEVWAKVAYSQGNEQYLADEKTAVQRIAFTIRYRTDINPTWRIRYQNKTYLIDAVAEIGRRVGLTLSSFSRGQES